MPRSDGPPGLRELQERFHALVTAPAGVAAALPQLGIGIAEVEELVQGDARLDAVGRLDVYANMYFYRLLDALNGDFPKLAALLGEDGFWNLITDYLVACPSENPSLRFAGARLPGFVAAHTAGRARPGLADLARLEWARADVFDRRDEPALAFAMLQRLQPEAFAALPLPLIAAHELLDMEHAADEIWRRIEHDEDSGAIESGPRRILVWRQDLAVRHRALGEPEARLLPRLREGKTPATFGLLCEWLGADLPAEAAAAVAFQLLGAWVTSGLIVDVSRV